MEEASEVALDFLGVSSPSELLRARGVAVGVALGVESSDASVPARWRGVDGTHSSLSSRWTGRLRERMDCVGALLKVVCSSLGDGMGGNAVGSSISSMGVGAALVPIVVQLKCDTKFGLPVPVAVVSVDCLFAISEGAAVDQLNLLRGWVSGTARKS